MSLGFILSERSQAVIWRGPKKTAMVRQFLTSTIWPKGLDYLLIDTPPGTSDEHISLVESLLKETAANPAQLAGAVVVTTPQAISVSDVKKELNFCKKTGVDVLGVLENMAGFVCPHCAHCTDVFSKGGGEAMAIEFEIPFLGRLPLDPAFVALIEEGKRPVYPRGTMVEGRDFGGQDDSTNSGAHDSAPLVEKYADCSLHAIFDGITRNLTDRIENKPR
jgi:Mrp family chromosome partitioning ATPase